LAEGDDGTTVLGDARIESSSLAQYTDIAGAVH
jgi:hypothetical protein